uniref:Uncharacterized protein n=1 Tax=Panagrolaimus sp. PS1159 TaxID=55785 RepID=A0AC35FSP6_9BILA
MHISIVIALFCIYSICCINAQGPYGAPLPNLGGGYGAALPPPPPMMQGGGGYGMEDFGPQQFGAYGNHPLPHGYGPKPIPPQPQNQGYGNPEMPPFAAQPARTFENQGYGPSNNGYNKQPQMSGEFRDNGLNEGFGFEGFKESNDENTSSSPLHADTSPPAHHQ